MLFTSPDQLEPAITGDSVIDVDDKVAFIQVQEAVDRSRLIPPPGHRPANISAGEKFVVANR